MSHGHEDIDKHVKVYTAVFLALLVLTVVTVLVSYLHLPLWLGILVALAVASLKGTLVAGYFMHLFQEKKIVLWILLLTVVLAIPLFLIPFFK